MRPDTLSKADAILVLNGMSPRGSLEAAKLYEEKWSRKILLSRERHPDGLDDAIRLGVKLEDAVQVSEKILTERHVPSTAIEVISNQFVGSTKEELSLLPPYLKKHPEIHSLIIVARRTQIRRCRSLFRKSLGNQIDLYFVPSRYDHLPSDGWWKEPWYLREVLYDLLLTVWSVG